MVWVAVVRIRPCEKRWSGTKAISNLFQICSAATTAVLLQLHLQQEIAHIMYTHVSINEDHKRQKVPRLLAFLCGLGTRLGLLWSGHAH